MRVFVITLLTVLAISFNANASKTSVNCWVGGNTISIDTKNSWDENFRRCEHVKYTYDSCVIEEYARVNTNSKLLASAISRKCQHTTTKKYKYK